MAVKQRLWEVRGINVPHNAAVCFVCGAGILTKNNSGNWLHQTLTLHYVANL